LFSDTLTACLQVKYWRDNALLAKRWNLQEYGLQSSTRKVSWQTQSSSLVERLLSFDINNLSSKYLVKLLYVFVQTKHLLSKYLFNLGKQQLQIDGVELHKHKKRCNLLLKSSFDRHRDVLTDEQVLHDALIVVDANDVPFGYLKRSINKLLAHNISPQNIVIISRETNSLNITQCYGDIFTVQDESEFVPQKYTALIWISGMNEVGVSFNAFVSAFLNSNKNYAQSSVSMIDFQNYHCESSANTKVNLAAKLQALPQNITFAELESVFKNDSLFADGFGCDADLPPSYHLRICG